MEYRDWNGWLRYIGLKIRLFYLPNLTLLKVIAVRTW